MTEDSIALELNGALLLSMSSSDAVLAALAPDGCPEGVALFELETGDQTCLNFM